MAAPGNELHTRETTTTAPSMCDRCDENARNSDSLDFDLYDAADKGHYTCVGALIMAGVDVNNSWNPLESAVENGHDKCVDILVKAEADVNNPWKPVISAVDNGRDKCLDILFKQEPM